ncbi:MAG: FtsX-like permease family protein, partial [Acidobacteriales bacterium]|nr:FtsX-like permease family protein [Terriglobales bacterium]
MNLIARIAPGVSPDQATSAVQSAFQSAAYIGLGAPMQGESLPVLSLQPARNFAGFDELYGTPLRILMAMVSLVLLIALTNVTTLLLARNANRQREFSVRMALGAGRADFLRQLLMEAALLVATGSALAWLFASTSTRLLARWAQIESSLAPDRVVLLFSLGLLVLAVGLLTLVPMRLVMRRRTDLALKTSAAASNADTSNSRVSRAVVVMQIALCLVLLVGAGLVVRTLRNLQNLPLGMNTDGLIVFGLNPQSIHSQPQVLLFYQEFQRRLRILPGVEAVSIMQDRLGSGWSNNFVSKYFVDTYLPNQNPLGHKVSGFTIVGVVADHKFRAINEAPVPMAFRAYAQAPQEGSMNIETRVRGNALAILPEVQKIVTRMDPDLPLIQPMLQREQYETTISTQLMFARLAEFFGLLAIVLVATGLYGALAYRVSRRTAEIGVRVAMGAQRAQLVWMILRQSLLATALGVALGLPVAASLGHALNSYLFLVK